MYFGIVLVTCLFHISVVIQLQIIKAEEYTVCKSPSLHPCNCGHGYYDGAIKYIVNCTNTGFNKTSMLTQLPLNVEVLIFTGNFIRELPINLFGQLNSLSKLQTIDMTNNQIRLIHGKTYHHVSNVKKLILNHNELEIDDDNHYSRIFSNFVNLLELHLTNAFADRSSGRRKEFTDDLYDIFMKSNLSQLYKLHLEQNEIEHFHEKNLFCNLQNLHDIYLSNNLIETFDFNIDCLNKIRFIDLELNRIEFLNETHFNLMDRIATNAANSKQTFIVDFKGNEFHCDKRFIHFYEWIRKSKVFVRDYNKITCYKYSKGLKETIFIKDYYDEQTEIEAINITGTNRVTYFATFLFLGMLLLVILAISVLAFVNSTYFKIKFRQNGSFYTKIESQQNRIYNL